MKTAQQEREIERRWLITDFNDTHLQTTLQQKRLSGKCQQQTIKQAYFPGTPNRTLRVRNTGDTAELTHKKGRGPVRTEHTINLNGSEDIFEFLTDNDLVYPIRKERYHFDGYELNCYALPDSDSQLTSADSLIILEREFDSEQAARSFTLPDWTGETEELTGRFTDYEISELLHNRNHGLLQFSIPEILSHDLKWIGITGGPGSGKTTLMNEVLSSYYGNLAVFVPEVARVVIEEFGFHPPVDDDSAMTQYQRELVKIQNGQRHLARLRAMRDEKNFVFLDRTLRDACAYTPGSRERFERITGTSIEYEKHRCDGIILLKVPSREIYEKHQADDPARHESYEEALAREQKILKVYENDPNLHTIPACDDWVEKITRVHEAIGQIAPKLA